MKDIVWDWVLSVDYPEIDEDHKKLTNIFNVLNHAVSEGESHEYLAAVMEELINCTVWHFSHEERLMLKHHYPDTEAHKEEHRDLIQSARELQQELLRTVLIRLSQTPTTGSILSTFVRVRKSWSST